MKRIVGGAFVAVLIAVCRINPAAAGQMVFLPRDAETHITLTSLPIAAAPTENSGSHLINDPIRVVSAKGHGSSPQTRADARRARMAAEHMRLRLHLVQNETLYSPAVEPLPLYPEKTTLNF